MKHRPPRALAVLAAVSIGALLPVSASAQAGLTGSPFSGQMEEMRGGATSSFGSNNQSALGQLEEISGGRVDRSSSSSQATTSQPRAPAPAKPRMDFNTQLKITVATTVVDALLTSLFSDNSAQQRARAQAQAEAAAREAAAQAEAFRIQQERARQARILRAQRYRAEWDAREGEITDRLSGAFDTGGGTVHRSFFGSSNASPDDPVVASILAADDAPAGSPLSTSPRIPGVPDPDAESTLPPPHDPYAQDTSVVDLRGVKGTVSLQRKARVSTRMAPPAGTVDQPRWLYEWRQPLSQHDPSLWPGLFGNARSLLRERIEEYFWDTLKDATVGRLWNLRKKIPGHQYFDAVNDFNEERKSMTEKVWGGIHEPILEYGMTGAMNSARILGSGRVSDYGYADEYNSGLISTVGRVERNNAKLMWSDIKKHLKSGEAEADIEEEPVAKTFVRSNPEGREMPDTIVVPSSTALHWRMSNLGSFGQTCP